MKGNSMFEGKKILITGGTGSLGRSLTNRLLEHDIDTIRIFSRNESQQINMESELDDDRLRFLLGDIRDRERLIRATEDIDIVFHTAALKHVPKIEYNPFEAINTNVIGSQNVLDACRKNNVEKAICIGTDKSVSPLNTYGATKLLMEKLFVTASNYQDPKKYPTKYIAVRYGNVMASSGSVVPRFIDQIKNNKKITITDPKMTRFSITMDEALDFIINATNSGMGSEIFVPKMRAYNIMDLKDALHELLGDFDVDIIGIRLGEKLHEVLIGDDEIRNTWEFNEMYMVTNPLYPLFHVNKIKDTYPKIKKIENLRNYSSDVAEKIPKEELVKMIKNSGFIN